MSAQKMSAEKAGSKKTELFDALEALEKTKGIPVDYMLEKIEAALISAYKKEEGSTSVRVAINREKGQIKLYRVRTVVEEVEDEYHLLVAMMNGDQKAKDVLIEHNLRLVIYVAKKYEGTTYGTLEDLKNINFINFTDYCLESRLFFFDFVGHFYNILSKFKNTLLKSYFLYTFLYKLLNLP